MPEIKFIDALPAPAAGRPSFVPQLIESLAARPGDWAEIARFPRGDRTRAYSRGQYMRSVDERVETAVRTIDGRTILFARVVTA